MHDSWEFNPMAGDSLGEFSSEHVDRPRVRYVSVVAAASRLQLVGNPALRHLALPAAPPFALPLRGLDALSVEEASTIGEDAWEASPATLECQPLSPTSPADPVGPSPALLAAESVPATA